MNPANLPPSSPPPADEDTRLERLLRESSSYIDDAGFTSRVIAGLPPRRRQPVLRRWALICGAVLLGCAAMAVFGAANPAAILVFLSESLSAWIAQPLPGATSMFTVGTALVLAFALGIGWRVCIRD